MIKLFFFLRIKNYCLQYTVDLNPKQSPSPIPRGEGDGPQLPPLRIIASTSWKPFPCGSCLTGPLRLDEIIGLSCFLCLWSGAPSSPLDIPEHPGNGDFIDVIKYDWCLKERERDTDTQEEAGHVRLETERGEMCLQVIGCQGFLGTP